MCYRQFLGLQPEHKRTERVRADMPKWRVCSSCLNRLGFQVPADVELLYRTPPLKNQRPSLSAGCPSSGLHNVNFSMFAIPPHEAFLVLTEGAA